MTQRIRTGAEPPAGRPRARAGRREDSDGTAPTRAIDEVAERMGVRYRLCLAEEVKGPAIFVSRPDHRLYDLLLRHRAGDLPCEIPLIVSNHPSLEPVSDQFGIEYRVFPIGAANEREQEWRRRGSDKADSLNSLAMTKRIASVSPHSVGETSSGRRPYGRRKAPTLSDVAQTRPILPLPKTHLIFPSPEDPADLPHPPRASGAY